MLPRPRVAQLSRRGKSWVMVLGGILAAVEIGVLVYIGSHWIRSNSLANVFGENRTALLVLLSSPFLTLVFSGGLRRQRELIRTGEVAVATITSTSNSSSQVNRNDDIRMVEYKFHDKDGTPLTGSSVDSTLLLREGSAMLVYYDGDDPSHQITQCASYYKVVGAGLDSDWLDDIG